MDNDAISRSAVLQYLCSGCSLKDHGETPACGTPCSDYTYIKDLPAVDAVPVVRCKDCRYSEPMPSHGVFKFGADALNCTQCRGDDGYGYAGISVIRPDDYCSDGTPKDGEAHD